LVIDAKDLYYFYFPLNCFIKVGDMDVKSILKTKLNSILNPDFDKAYIRGFFYLGASFIGLPSIIAMASVFYIESSAVSFFAEINNSPSLVSISIGFFCLVVSLYLYLVNKGILDKKLNGIENKSSKNHINYFEGGFVSKEVGKRVVLDKKDRLLVLSEVVEKSPSIIKLTITRFSKNGELDFSFGASGKVILDFDSDNTQVGHIMSNENCDVFIAAHSILNGNFQVLVCKLKENGQFDTSYGNQGVISLPVGAGHAYANHAYLQSDDSVFTVGHQFSLKSLVVTKFDSTGQLDKNFGVNGISIISKTSDHDWGVAVSVIAPMNRLLVLFNSGHNSSIVCLNNDGKIYNKFGNNGFVDLNSFLEIKHMMKATSIALLNDGRILVSGYGNQGVLLCLKADGSLDLTFAQGGIAIIRGYHRTELQKVIVARDGKIFVAGNQSDGNSIMEGLITALNNDGSVYTDFGEKGYLYLKGNTKQRVTDIVAINKSNLIVLVEQDVMSYGYETTFLCTVSI
jgi:uncharacterized delta-60 repeat protein